jgi:hypothetical protein
VNPSERVQLIQAIAKALGALSYDKIALTFRQFSLEYEDTNRSVTEWWLIETVESASDDVLVALAEHCGVSGLPSAKRTDGGPWETDGFRLFLSHLSVDKTFIAALRDHLRPRRVTGFVAHVDIEPTKEWEVEITRALNTADALCALLTKDFHSSKWTDQEVGIAVGRDLLVIPIRAGLDPYGFIGKYQALQGAGKQADVLAAEITDILARHPLTRERYAEVVVSAFESAWSWENCRADMALLERFEYLSPSHLQRIENAVTDNEKVSTSYGVPVRVERLVARIRETG